MTILNILESPQAKSTFYPTPPGVAVKLLNGINWDMIESVLEPSAGKGDLVKAVIDKKTAYCRHSGVDFDCVEIDPNLRAILKDKGYRVVHDDFLSFRTYKHYDLIVMNPPFDRGDAHLLKAIEMQKNGGMVVCVLNAETIRNTFSRTRKALAQKLNEYNAVITYEKNAFHDAERKTDVEVAIIKCTIPHTESDGDILENLRRSFKAEKEAPVNNEQTYLAKDSFMDAIVDKYNFEAAAGVRLIEEYTTLEPYLLDSLDNEESTNSKYPIIIIASPHGGHHGAANGVNANYYIRKTRRKYWKALFANPKFLATMTTNLQETLYNRLDDLEHYDFSICNIMQLRIDLSKQVNTNIEETIMKLFDDWTFKWHYDEYSQNVHLFNGWKTNDAFAVNKKVIIPFYGVWDDWSGKFRPTDYRISRSIRDIQKTFDYLSGRVGDGSDIDTILKAAENDGISKKIQLKYFKATFYKKGTMHIEFTDLAILEKFNLFAAQNKNWLPPCYGKKKYSDMTVLEKHVIDSFQGEKAYENILNHADYYLRTGTSQTLMLGGGIS